MKKKGKKKTKNKMDGLEGIGGLEVVVVWTACRAEASDWSNYTPQKLKASDVNDSF